MHEPILIVACQTALEMTQKKWLSLAPLLQSAGYDPHICTWEPSVLPWLAEKKIPFTMLSLQQKEFDRTTEAEKVYNLLDRPIANLADAPTWGQLLAYDDFIGAATFFEVCGMGALRPAAILTSFQGAESSTVEDENILAGFARFATLNKIPVLALEVQSVECELNIARWPVDCLLTKQVYTSPAFTKDYAQVTFPLTAPHRYFATFSIDPMMEDFLAQEKQLRQQLAWQPGQRYILFPFHLYYIAYCYQMLGVLSRYATQLAEHNITILVHCGTAHRRNLQEKDIIEAGKRWWQGLPSLKILEGGRTMDWLFLSDAVLLPYPHNVIEGVADRWGIPIIRPGLEERVWKLTPRVTILEALAWVLEEEKRKKENSK